MSTRPQSLIDVSKYLQEKTGLKAKWFSIRAARSSGGFHAGSDEIFGPNGKGNRDKSMKGPRNKAGLSKASSAIDIHAPNQLKALTAHLVANHGDLIYEVIGKDADGKPCYWGVPSNWQPKYGWTQDKGDHIHCAFFRDTEFSDRLAPFRSFYEVPVPPAPEPEPVEEEQPNSADVEALEAENAELKERIAAIAVLANG